MSEDKIKKLHHPNGHIPDPNFKPQHKIDIVGDQVVISSLEDPSVSVSLGGGSYTVLPINMNGFDYPVNTSLHADDQGDYGSCVAHSICQAIENLYYRGTGKRDSYGKTFSVQWVYGNRVGLSCQTEGMYLTETIDRLLRDGVPLCSDLTTLASGISDTTIKNNIKSLAQEQHEYVASDELNVVNYYGSYISSYEPILTSSTSTQYTAKDVVATSYSYVKPSSGTDLANKFKPVAKYTMDASDITSIKNALVAFSPVIFAISVPNVDYCMYVTASNGVLDRIHYAGEHYTADQTLVGDFYLRNGSHAMIIVGWTTINGIECWKIKNSWGTTSAGGAGFIYIPTSLFSSLGSELHCLQIVNNADNLLFSKSWYYSNITAFYGNTSAEYAKGKKLSRIMMCDIFNNLTYYVNAKRASVSLAPINVDWCTTSRNISASLFNNLKNGFNEYYYVKYGISNKINIADKVTGNYIVGSEIWTLLDTIQNNL